MRAAILAGGLGTRLRSIVTDRPKPMAVIAGKPFLEHQIEFLKCGGVTDVVLCVGYLHEHIERHFGDGARWGVNIFYSVEQELLGTAGALKHAARFLPGRFLALNGDSFHEFAAEAVAGFHIGQQPCGTDGACLGTIVLTEADATRGYGSVAINDRHRVLGFTEKPETATASRWINAGVYFLEPSIFDLIPSGRKVSLERETFPAALQRGYHIFGYPSSGYFVDIGTTEGFRRFGEYLHGRRG